MGDHNHSIHKPHENCCSCISRRKCVGMLSAAALGLTMGAPGLAMAAPSRRQQQRYSSDYVDVTKLRPKPNVRIVHTFLELPRPYWLGWPGTTYDLDSHEKEYRSKLDDSCRRLGITAECEGKPISEEAGLTALVNRIKSNKPDALLITLQHRNCWRWVNNIVKDLGVPLIVFAPIGLAFVGDVRISRLPGVYVVSSLEWQAVEKRPADG